MRCPASSSVTSIQRTAGAVESAGLPSVGIRVYYIWLISKKSTRHLGPLPGIIPGTRIDSDERGPLKAPKQANVARLRIQAAMVNESTRSTHHEFHASAGPQCPQTPDEENKKSSLSLTTA